MRRIYEVDPLLCPALPWTARVDQRAGRSQGGRRHPAAPGRDRPADECARAGSAGGVTSACVVRWWAAVQEWTVAVGAICRRCCATSSLWWWGEGLRGRCGRASGCGPSSRSWSATDDAGKLRGSAAGGGGSCGGERSRGGVPNGGSDSTPYPPETGVEAIIAREGLRDGVTMAGWVEHFFAEAAGDFASEGFDEGLGVGAGAAGEGSG